MYRLRIKGRRSARRDTGNTTPPDQPADTHTTDRPTQTVTSRLSCSRPLLPCPALHACVDEHLSFGLRGMRHAASLSNEPRGHLR
mmetsp:Transcript_43664/g.123705  ORF Transcript_43664/g.123705 Transcript_43664/m.123705 type:complete len:85 (-) Transcript_43664:200-454(-)